MKNIFLAFALVFSVLFVACDKKEKISDSDIGLRKTTIENENSVVLLGEVNYTGVQAGESAILERSFENAPPLVSHTMEEYLPITKDSNACLSCHIKELAADMNTKPAPASHYFDFQANKPSGDNVSNERWNCDQCHIAQTDAKPLVGNKFQAVFKNDALKTGSDFMDTAREGVVEEQIKTYGGSVN